MVAGMFNVGCPDGRVVKALRVRLPLVFSGTPKVHPLVSGVFCFVFVLLPAACMSPSPLSKSEAGAKIIAKKIEYQMNFEF